MNGGKGPEKCPPLVFFNTLGAGFNSGLSIKQALSKLSIPISEDGQFSADCFYFVKDEVFSFF